MFVLHMLHFFGHYQAIQISFLDLFMVVWTKIIGSPYGLVKNLKETAVFRSQLYF